MQRKPVVISFKGSGKPLVLNKTNSVMLAGISGSEDTDSWPGALVTLFGAMVAYQGRVTEGVRIGRPKSAEAASVSPAPSTPDADLNDEIPF